MYQIESYITGVPIFISKVRQYNTNMLFSHFRLKFRREMVIKFELSKSLIKNETLPYTLTFTL